MGMVVGGKDAWRTHVRRGILVSLQWIDLQIEREAPRPEPCMVIANANARTRENRAAWVIPMGEAWRYREAEISVQQARKAAVFIGLGDSGRDVMRVLDAIHEALDEFLDMPPSPPSGRRAAPIGDVLLRQNGQVIRGFEVGGDGRLLH